MTIQDDIKNKRIDILTIQKTLAIKQAELAQLQIDAQIEAVTNPPQRPTTQ